MTNYLEKHPMMSISLSMISLMVLIGLIVEMPDNADIIWIVAIVFNIISMLWNGIVGYFNLKKLDERKEITL